MIRFASASGLNLPPLAVEAVWDFSNSDIKRDSPSLANRSIDRPGRCTCSSVLHR